MLEAHVLIESNGCAVRREDLELDSLHSNVASRGQRCCDELFSNAATTVEGQESHPEPTRMPKTFQWVSADVAPTDDLVTIHGNEMNAAFLLQLASEVRRRLVGKRLEKRDPLAFFRDGVEHGMVAGQVSFGCRDDRNRHENKIRG